VLTLLRHLAAIERATYLADVGLKAQAERWLHLAAECALDLAQHLIADRGYRTPGTNREACAILRDQGVLEDGRAPEPRAQMGGPEPRMGWEWAWSGSVSG